MFIFAKRVLFLCGVLSFTVTNLLVLGGKAAECKIQARLGSIRKLDGSILCLKKKKKTTSYRKYKTGSCHLYIRPNCNGQ